MWRHVGDVQRVDSFLGHKGIHVAPGLHSSANSDLGGVESSGSALTYTKMGLRLMCFENRNWARLGQDFVRKVKT
jgi:hypothetical protein